MPHAPHSRLRAESTRSAVSSSSATDAFSSGTTAFATGAPLSASSVGATPASAISTGIPARPFTRRAFLQHTTAAGVGLALGAAAAPSALAGARDARHRYAIVGTGSRSRMYHDALERDFRSQARLALLCDSNPGRLQLASARSLRLSGNRPALCAPAEFEAALAREGVQTVIVTTVDGTHHEYIVRALEAGCDVVTEKPMTTTPEKCQRILDAQARTGRRCRVTFNVRYAPACTQVKDLLMSGAIGEILSVDLHWMLDTFHGADYMRRWHSIKENSGGLMIHKASHHFDLANWLIGAVPATVFATGARDFYVPATLRRMGLAGPGRRCLDCAEAARCPFHIDLRSDASLKELYLDHERHDSYLRDRCPFREEIDIEDTMSVNVRYDNGVALTYSLNAFCAWEGYTIAFNGTRGRLEHSAGGLTADGRVKPGALRTTILPTRGAPRPVEVWTGVGAHQGGDKVLLEDLFLPSPAPDKYLRAADHRAGAYATLIGMAANQCFKTQRPVAIADLVHGLKAPDYPPMPTRTDPLPLLPRTRV